MNQEITSDTAVIARKEYLAGLASHEDYYAQFVTEATKGKVRMAFTSQELAEAFVVDESFRTIPVDRWDRFSFTFLDARRTRFVSAIVYDHPRLVAAGDYATQAGLVCIAKAAARIVVREDASDD